MASKITSLWDSVLVEASALTPALVAGELRSVLDSGDVDNETGTIYNSLKTTIKYELLDPDAAGATFFLTCLVEFKDTAGTYKYLAHQFNPFNKSSNGESRVLILQPNIDTFNLGVDDDIFPIDRTICKISRSQGELPQGQFRVLINLQDNAPAGANPFVSVKVSGEVEQYSV